MHAETAIAARSGRPIDSRRAQFALLGCATVAEVMLLVLPSFVGALTDNLQLPPHRVGLLGSADMLGIAAVGASGPIWIHRIRWRVGALGALLALLACNAACFGLRQFVPLLALRLLAGVAAGFLYSISLVGVVSTRDPARTAGLLLFSEVLVSAAGVFLLDSAPIHWRLDAVYGYVLVCLVPFIAIAGRFFPEDPGIRPSGRGLPWSVLMVRASLLLLGAGSYFLMIGGVWGYLEGIARAAGLPLRQTGQALSVGLLVSLLGAGAAAGVGLRFGRVLPLLLSAAIQLLALGLLMMLRRFDRPLLAFYLINAAFQVAWSYVVPYFMVLFREVEPNGRFVPMYSMAMHLTLAVGPYAGAFFVQGHSYAGLLGFGTALTVLCYAAFLTAVLLDRSRLEARFRL